MIQEFSFSFSELNVDPAELAALLGYPDGDLPEPFPVYVEEAMTRAATFDGIRGAVLITGQIQFLNDDAVIEVNGVSFEIGKTLAKELRGASQVALFICTAGPEISQLSRDLMLGDDPILGYVYDILGSVTVEMAMDKIHRQIQQQSEEKGLKVTNRYSPGYCNWGVTEQHKLFSLFPKNFCGISLTDSALMHPIKSVSGIFGIGKDVKYREYTCDLCGMKECFYRHHGRKEPVS